MPECLEDLKDWRPKSYAEHFAASRFGNRAAAIHAYRAAEPGQRRALDSAAEALNATLAAAIKAAITPGAPAGDKLARRALREARPLVARLSVLINGGSGGLDRTSAQATIDAMFRR